MGLRGGRWARRVAAFVEGAKRRRRQRRGGGRGTGQVAGAGVVKAGVGPSGLQYGLGAG